MCVCLCASAEYNRHLVSLRKIVPPLELIYPQPATTILIRNGRDSKNVNVRFRLELGNFWPYTYGCTSEIVRYNRYCTLKGFYFFSPELMVDGISLSFFTATFLFYPRTNVSEIIVFFPAAFDRLVVANTPTAEPPARRGSSPIPQYFIRVTLTRQRL